MMALRYDSERLRGFCNRLTDRQIDIFDSRFAFATENTIRRGNKVILL